MRKHIAVVGIGALLALQGCSVKGDPLTSVEMSLADSASDGISREKALEVANREMLTAGQVPAGRDIANCKLSLGRLIIYDDGSEYFVGKGGQTLDSGKIPLGVRPGEMLTTVASNTGIDKKAAIRITDADAESVYSSVDRFKKTACELPAVWRIIYELGDGASGGGPDYVVDKRTGAILYKKYSQ
ncbi:MAG: hypothetical protein LC795_02185 [Acidobacteria bacterium]|nr:hypothetical protein [Acidobacteriota bacterium]